MRADVSDSDSAAHSTKPVSEQPCWMRAVQSSSSEMRPKIFIIVTDDAQDAMSSLVDVFEGEEASECNFFDRFSFAIDCDEGWEGVGGFQSIIQVFAYVGRDERFQVIE